MIKQSLLLLSALLSVSWVYGQKSGGYYIPISMDSTQGCRLRFLGDSTVELSSIHRHMGPSIQSVHKYLETDSTITVFPGPANAGTLQPSRMFIQSCTLEKELVLTKIKKGFIDYERKRIYVSGKDFGAHPDLAYVIDGRTYILGKKRKKNKALQNRLKTIKPENSTMEFFRGLAAYERFGMDRVYGVFVIAAKN